MTMMINRKSSKFWVFIFKRQLCSLSAQLVLSMKTKDPKFQRLSVHYHCSVLHRLFLNSFGSFLKETFLVTRPHWDETESVVCDSSPMQCEFFFFLLCSKQSPHNLLERSSEGLAVACN